MRESKQDPWICPKLSRLVACAHVRFVDSAEFICAQSEDAPSFPLFFQLFHENFGSRTRIPWPSCLHLMTAGRRKNVELNVHAQAPGFGLSRLPNVVWIVLFLLRIPCVSLNLCVSRCLCSYAFDVRTVSGDWWSLCECAVLQPNKPHHSVCCATRVAFLHRQRQCSLSLDAPVMQKRKTFHTAKNKTIITAVCDGRVHDFENTGQRGPNKGVFILFRSSRDSTILK